MPVSRSSLVVLCLGVTLVKPLDAEEWARFRGPNGAGVSPARLPTTWTEKDYNWRTPLPGVGHSSPVVWGDRVFVTAGEPQTGKRIVLCIGAKDGKVLWTSESDSEKYRTHKRNSFATATPCVDAERVYVTWATPEKHVAVAYTHAGEQAWLAELGPYKGGHGYGVSTIRFDDLLIIPNDQDGGGSIIALEAATGKVRWEVPRGGKNATYSTPCVLQQPGKPAELIFTNWQLGVTSVDPKTGKTNWEISVFDTTTQERAVSSPVLAGDLLLATCGFVTGKKHMVALRPGPDGPKEVWRIEKSVSYMPTPLVKGDRVYLCSEVGMATCLESATGKIVWQERLGADFSASPVCAGEHIYCLSNDGDVYVLEAKDEFKLVARNSLGEPSQSTPAIAGSRMYLRTEKSLICVGGE